MRQNRRILQLATSTAWLVGFMSEQMRSRRLISLGFVLVLLGFVLPFAMVLRIIEPGFLLSFLSYGASVAGLLLGLIGASQYNNPGNP